MLALLLVVGVVVVVNAVVGGVGCWVLPVVWWLAFLSFLDCVLCAMCCVLSVVGCACCFVDASCCLLFVVGCVIRHLLCVGYWLLIGACYNVACWL